MTNRRKASSFDDKADVTSLLELQKEMNDENASYMTSNMPKEVKEDSDEQLDKLHNNVIRDIPVQICAVLGRAKIEISRLITLGRGAIIELDRRVGDPVDIYVNNRLVARGGIVILEERLGVTMTEIVRGER
jgi:flagellar motor switch protein FliN/FliY